MATLSFEYGPDSTATGGVADTTVADVRFGPVVGFPASSFTTPVSAPQSGDDGVREWTVFSATVAFDPAVRHRVEIENRLGYLGSWDSTHLRRLKIIHLGVDYLPQYPEGVRYSTAQNEGMIVYEDGSREIGITGDTVAAMWSGATCEQDTIPGLDYAYWFFGGVSSESSCGAAGGTGWSVAGVRL